MRHTSLARLAALALCGPSLAQGPNVMLASADYSDCTLQLAADLMASGRFASVDYFDAMSMTPTLAECQQYDVVMTWSNFQYDDGVALGDVLADYVDGGGGVVVAMFGHYQSAGSYRPSGRWSSPTYQVIAASTFNGFDGPHFLGSVLEPTHPVVAGFTTFDGGSGSFRPADPTVTPGSTRLAEWDDGSTMVAVGANPRRVDLGIWPSNDAYCTSAFNGWNSTTDGQVLIENALAFVGSGGIGSSYCDQTVANSSGATGGIDAFGSIVAATNDLTLVAFDLPPQSFGFFLVSRIAGLTIRPGGSEGNLCLGGLIGRYVGPGQIQNTGAAGEFSLALDLTAIPQPMGSVAALTGETWRFQGWHRDMVGGSSTSNFTSGIEITFQ